MESKYSYQFTKSAKNDLEQILHYIKIDLGNPTAAFSFINKFQEAVSNIQLFPNSCPKVINKFLSALSNIEHYKSADIHKRGEAATLKLTSYEWNFDIVPCFYTVDSFYLIPDGKGNWKATNPNIDQELITNVNQEYNGLVLQLIRTLKYWNRHNSTNTIGSYLFEQIVINFVNQKTELSQWIDFDIRDFFSYLSNNIFSPVYDPKGIQGNINSLTIEEQNSISKKAKWAFNKAKEAISAEINEKNQEKAAIRALYRAFFEPQTQE